MSSRWSEGIGAFPRATAIFGAAVGAAGTAMGAIGAHWVTSHANERVAAAFQAATAFSLWHALALLLLAVASHADPASRQLRAVSVCWMTGITLFAGSLWLRGLGIDARIVVVAPAGGSMLILGWILAVLYLAQLPSRR